MKRFFVMAISIALILTVLVPVMAQDSTNTADERLFVLANGMGAGIVEIVVAPARGVYRRNLNRLHLSGFLLEDKAFFEIVLHDNFRGVNSFDIAVVTIDGRGVAHQNVKLNFSDEATPILEVSRTRSPSSFEDHGGAIGALAGGLTSVTILSMSTLAIVSSSRDTIIVNRGWLHKVLRPQPPLHMQKPPRVIKGPGKFYIIPVVAMIGGYLIGNQFEQALRSRGLDVQVRYL